MIDGDMELQRMGGEGPTLEATENMMMTMAEMFDELARKINDDEITTMEQMNAEMMKLGQAMMGDN